MEGGGTKGRMGDVIGELEAADDHNTNRHPICFMRPQAPLHLRPWWRSVQTEEDDIGYL